MLTAKNTGRWMVLSISARNKKTRVQNKVPFPKLAHSSNNLKAMASGKSLTRVQKTYTQTFKPYYYCRL